MKVGFRAQYTSLKTPWQKEPEANQKPILPSVNRAVPQDIPQEMSQVSLQQVLANRMWQTMFLPEVGCFFLVFTRLEGRPWTYNSLKHHEEDK